jgi:hypothetical protein
VVATDGSINGTNQNGAYTNSVAGALLCCSILILSKINYTCKT